MPSSWADRRTPGIGFGAGIERILLACDAEGVFGAPESTVDVFVIDTTGGEQALTLTHDLRAAGVSADRAVRRAVDEVADEGRRSFRRPHRVDRRDRTSSPSATVTVRDLRHTGAEGEPGQQAIPRQEVVDYVRKSL